MCVRLESEGGVGETQHKLLMVEEGMTLRLHSTHHISVPSFIKQVSCRLITGPAFWNFVGPSVTVRVWMCGCVYIHVYIYNVCIYTYYMYMYVYLHVLFATPWTVAHQDPLSMGFPRQDYCSG